MEKEKAFTQNEEARSSKRANLQRVFGEDYTKLLEQISHDEPDFTEDEVLEYGLCIMTEATAYMQPAHPEDLLHHAIIIHEGYEAFRRTQD